VAILAESPARSGKEAIQLPDFYQRLWAVVGHAEKGAMRLSRCIKRWKERMAAAGTSDGSHAAPVNL